jgi:uncharacterized protein YjbI with pentapeptide repeats
MDANAEHLGILRQGIDRWNAWRKQTTEAPDLSRAPLSEANLIGGDFSGANLTEANLERALVGSANLHHADLRKANLRDTDLRESTLAWADLEQVFMGGAYLRGSTFFTQTCAMPI